ncbi:hypothetical protein K523DRAFT_353106 [Schizophyllum commune Tattone D]|nr:hypothetical protein K525DRAFT_223398 [Schizophyllum commune Loenen D]KAI5828812.1 hypothetical protein K523DRAFT_353106 [Schizophyllum commune Tattone D]
MHTHNSANPKRALSASSVAPSPQSFVFKSSRYTAVDPDVQPGWVRRRPKLSDTLLRSHATGATNVVDSPNGFIPLPNAKTFPQSLSRLPIFLQANGLAPIESQPTSPCLSPSPPPSPKPLPLTTPQSTPALSSASFSPVSPPSILRTPPNSLSCVNTRPKNTHSLSLTEVFAELRTPPATASGSAVSKYGLGPSGSYFPLLSEEITPSRKSYTPTETDRQDRSVKMKVIENAEALLRALEWQGAGAKLRERSDELDAITEKLAALSLESAGSDTASSVADSEHEQDVG